MSEKNLTQRVEVLESALLEIASTPTLNSGRMRAIAQSALQPDAMLALESLKIDLGRTDEGERHQVEEILSGWRRRAFLYRHGSLKFAIRILYAEIVAAGVR